MDLYCHSEPPLTSGKLCFIINFIGGHREPEFFYWGGGGSPFEPPLFIPCLGTGYRNRTNKKPVSLPVFYPNNYLCMIPKIHKLMRGVLTDGNLF